MRLEEFDFHKFDNKNILIVYGTSVFGEIVYYCLKQKNIIPDYFVARESEKYFHGIPVINIDKMAEIYGKKAAIILLAVGMSSKDIAIKLRKKNVEIVYSSYRLLEEIRDMKKILPSIYKEMNRYQYEQDCFINGSKLIMYSLDVVVTEKCSLRCANCSNLMQYYSNPQNIDINEIRNNLDKLLTIVDCIYELRFLGGEPFMNPDFHILINWYVKNEKIKKIVIYTNGTIFPSETIREKFKNPKILLRISNYGKLSGNIREWSQWCENNKVDYDILEVKKWHDVGKLEKHNYSLEEIEYIYKTCECKDVPTLIRNKLYNCPYAANAINLNALYDEEAQMDSLEINGDQDAKDKIKEFLFERKFLMACDYCAGRNFSRASVPAYIQAERPLEYIKRS